MPYAGDKTGPRPKSWKTLKLMEWLNMNPVTEFYDVEYLIKMADQRKIERITKTPWTIGKGRYLFYEWLKL